MKRQLPDYVLVDLCPFCQAEMTEQKSGFYYFCSRENNHLNKMIWFGKHTYYLRFYQNLNFDMYYHTFEITPSKNQTVLTEDYTIINTYNIILPIDDLVSLNQHQLQQKLEKLSNFE